MPALAYKGPTGFNFSLHILSSSLKTMFWRDIFDNSQYILMRRALCDYYTYRIAIFIETFNEYLMRINYSIRESNGFLKMSRIYVTFC